MTCKDCVHYEVCGGFIPTDLDRDVFDYVREGRSDEIPNIEERCSEAKPKSRFVELPCEVGQTVYSIVEGINLVFVGKIYECVIGREHFVFRSTRKGYFTLAFTEIDIGKTVFLSREEAEKALKERERE